MLDRLDPHNRAAVERLLRDRPRRLAAMNDLEHRAMWPRTVAQVAPMARAMADEQAVYLGDDHPHVRWLRGG